MSNSSFETQIRIQVYADGFLPAAKHTRTFVPPAPRNIETDDQGGFEFEIPATEQWKTLEPVNLGPEDKLWQNLHGSKVLDSKRHPKICVSGQWLPKQNLVKVTVQLRGKFTSLELAATEISKNEYKLTADSSLKNFGLKKFKALLGAIYLEDKLQFTITAQKST